MSRRWVPHDTRDQIVDYVNRWTERTEISAQQLLGWAGIPVPTFTGWRKNYGRAYEHNGWIPRDNWLTDDEKQAIIKFHYEHPLEGYRRLTVYNVLRQADVLRPRGKESRKGKGLVQPLTAHEHWHVDVAYINIAGTFVFMAKLGEHELTDDGRKNLQRHEKPRNNRLTLTDPQVSLRRIGLCWEATRASERCHRQVL